MRKKYHFALNFFFGELDFFGEYSFDVEFSYLLIYYVSSTFWTRQLWFSEPQRTTLATHERIWACVRVSTADCQDMPITLGQWRQKRGTTSTYSREIHLPILESGNFVVVFEYIHVPNKLVQVSKNFIFSQTFYFLRSIFFFRSKKIPKKIEIFQDPGNPKFLKCHIFFR